jgi:hypothetical protein
MIVPERLVMLRASPICLMHPLTSFFQPPLSPCKYCLYETCAYSSSLSSLDNKFSLRRRHRLYKRLRRRIRLDNLALYLRNSVLRFQNANLHTSSVKSSIPPRRHTTTTTSSQFCGQRLGTYHCKQPPRSITRLRPYTHPIPRPRYV